MRKFLKTQASVQRTGCALEVALRGHSGLPGAHGMLHGKVFRGESATFVRQGQSGGLYGESAAFHCLCELWHRQFTVHYSQRSPVLKNAVGGPFHADEPVRKHGKAGIVKCHYRTRGGYRVVLGVCAQAKTQKDDWEYWFHSLYVNPIVNSLLLAFKGMSS